MIVAGIGILLTVLIIWSYLKKQKPGLADAEAICADHAASGRSSMDPLLLAAISAAIIAYMEQEKKNVIGMIRRDPAALDKSWVLSGRMARMNHNITKHREGGSR